MSKKIKIAILVFLSVTVITGILLVLVILKRTNSDKNDSNEADSNNTYVNQQDSEAVQAGKLLSHNKCTGSGPIELTSLPMDQKDFSILIPYGLVVGAHVTPIDHQYFSPTVFNSPRDTYDVMAPADGHIVEIGARPRENPNNSNDKFEEYRIVFSHTCTFLTYFDLVTSLSPDLKAEYDKTKDSSGYASGLDFSVESGEVIGKIGGQTLDFAVWDTEKPLTGFIVPEHYEAESWKLYTANPYDYFSTDLAEILKQKNPRTTEPIQGKIDYDIDGKLVGNWFLENTNGYGGLVGEGGGSYWAGHLSIAPDLYDPTGYIFSVGDFQGQAKQFLITNQNFKPENIGVESGIQKLEMRQYSYNKANGQRWDSMSYTSSPTVNGETYADTHCALVQLTENRKLKLELFPKKRCSQVQAFTSAARTYER